MSEEKSKHTFGWSDYQQEHGRPDVKVEYFDSSRRYDWALAACYVGLFLSLTMVTAPMVWVELIKWVLK